MPAPRNKMVKRSPTAGKWAGGKAGYFCARAWSNIRQNMALNLLTVGTIFLALLLFSLFLLVYDNIEGAAARWSKKVQVAIYFDRELDLREMARLKGEIQRIPGTEKITYVSRPEAMERFKLRLKGQESLLEGVSAEILPSSLEISISRETRTSSGIEGYVTTLRKISGIGDIQYGEEWVRRFNGFLSILRFSGLLLGAFLTLTVVFIVSNTIKLTIYNRRDELELLDLVGATPLFIRIPFLLEGLLQGVAAGALALALLFGIYYGFIRNAGNFIPFNPAEAQLSFLPGSQIAGIFLGGIIAALGGTLASLRRFMRTT